MKNGGLTYLEESARTIAMVKDPVVLKADLWNEAEDIPAGGGIVGNIKARAIFAIEVDPELVAQARRRLGGDIVLQEGDIRNLPYDNTMFDIILDLSTIDHVCPNELERTIAGYARVLKHGGYMLMVAWCDEQYAGSMEESSMPGAQYFFHHPSLIGYIECTMDVLEQETLLRHDDGKFLVRILARKRPTEAQKGEG